MQRNKCRQRSLRCRLLLLLTPGRQCHGIHVNIIGSSVDRRLNELRVRSGNDDKTILKIHQNKTDYSYTVDVSVSIRDHHLMKVSQRPKRRQCKNNCCIPVAQVATRRHLCSAARHQLTVPRHLSQHVRAAGICCRWSDDVQRSAR